MTRLNERERMTLEQQIVSLELSRELEALGVKQESVLWWIRELANEDFYLCLKSTMEAKSHAYPEMVAYAALTVAELGELLPRSFDYDVSENGCRSVHLTSGKTLIDSGWYVMYNDPHPANKVPVYAQHAPTEAEARGLMLKYLLVNKLIELVRKDVQTKS